MVQVKKNKVIFSSDALKKLKKNPVYFGLVEDIENRLELEKAIQTHKKRGESLIDFNEYDKKRMQKIEKAKKALLQEINKELKMIKRKIILDRLLLAQVKMFFSSLIFAFL